MAEDILQILPGVAKVRVDQDLTGIGKLMGQWFEYPEIYNAEQKEGKKIVVVWPLNPTEPYFAADVNPYDILGHEATYHGQLEEDFGEREGGKAIKAGEEAGLSVDSCRFNCCWYGAFMTDSTLVKPDAFSMFVGPWCDNVAKSWQLASTKKELPLHAVDTPVYHPDKEDWAIDYMVKELEDLMEWLARISGRETTEQDLKEQIKIHNECRKMQQEITKFLSLSKVPINALDHHLSLAINADWFGSPEKALDALKTLYDEVKERAKKGIMAPNISEDNPRIFWIGMPTTDYLKTFSLIEDLGGTYVGQDVYWTNCYDLMDERKEPLEAIAEWTWKMPYNIPTEYRMEATLPLIKESNPDGAIYCCNFGCHNWGSPALMIRDVLKEELGIPTLILDATVPAEHGPEFREKIGSFIDMLK